MRTSKDDAKKTPRQTYRERPVLISHDIDPFDATTLEVALDDDVATFVIVTPTNVHNEYRSISVRISAKDVLAMASRIQTFPFRKDDAP